MFGAELAAVQRIETHYANVLLDRWGHKLGPVNRPFRSEAYALVVDGKEIAVAVSASSISNTVAGYKRTEVVELARCAAAQPWANRVMLRLWREVCAPRWACWSVRAAISYSHNAMHTGDLYRFDGWEKVRDDCGSSGGGGWSSKRNAGEKHHGKKTLWLWRYSVPSLIPGADAQTRTEDLLITNEAAKS